MREDVRKLIELLQHPIQLALDEELIDHIAIQPALPLKNKMSKIYNKSLNILVFKYLLIFLILKHYHSKTCQ